MSQQWEHQMVKVQKSSSERYFSDDKVNAVLADWSARGWELVNGSVLHYDSIYLFWRRAK